MPSGTFAEQMAATAEAMKQQQDVAKRLAGTLSQLAMDVESIAAQFAPSELAGKGCSVKLMDVDMIMPGTPEAVTKPVPSLARARLPLKAHLAWCDVKEAPEVPEPAVCGKRQKFQLDGAIQHIRSHSRHRRMFADPEELREQIREHLTDKAFDVTTLYKDAGICQAMMRGYWFETVSMFLVIFSAVWMAVEIDHNHSDSLHEADVTFQVVSNLLCVLFSIEIWVRICAFRHLSDAMKQGWIVFDLLLVLFAVIEVWILGAVAALADTALAGGGLKFILVFRILRLLRILRLARVFQYLPELLVIVRGLGRAVRAIIVVLVLIGLTIFVAAIVFTALLEGSALGSELFSTVSQSMATLMLDCTLSGARGTKIMRDAWRVHPIFGILMLLFVLVSNVTMLGVLTGLLVQTVKTVAEVEKEEKSVKQLVCTMEELWRAMLRGDVNKDGKIEMSEFAELLDDKATARILLALDVDVEGLASVAGFVFHQHQGLLGRKEFLQMVLDVRNSNKARVKDHIETRKFMQAALLNMPNETTC